MQLRYIAVVILMGMLASTNDTEAAQLDALRWKNRVLVVIAPDGDFAAAKQRQIYRKSETGMIERAIVLVEALGDGAREREIRARLGADGDRFQVLLIGKDGNTALTSKVPVEAEELFAKIDAMPMRRREMQLR